MSLEATLATWELEELCSTEKLLLLSLARRAGEAHECWPSVRRICSDTGLDRKSVISHRQNLISKGLIAYTGEMKGRSLQVPVMHLIYVDIWEQKETVPLLTLVPKRGLFKSLPIPKGG